MSYIVCATVTKRLSFTLVFSFLPVALPCSPECQSGTGTCKADHGMTSAQKRRKSDLFAVFRSLSKQGFAASAVTSAERPLNRRATSVLILTSA